MFGLYGGIIFCIFMRSKRSSFVLNLIETPNGFSIVEGTELLNRVEGAQQPTHAPLTTASLANLHTHAPAPRQYRPIFKKTNLVFLKGTVPPPSEGQTAQEEGPIDTPTFCRVICKWFDLNSVHQNQVKEVKSWLQEKLDCEDHQLQARQEETVQQVRLYRKHRNFIVGLYARDFAEDRKYLSACCIRKYLSCDASWIMRIHVYLTNLGVINVHSLNALESNTQLHILKTKTDGKKTLLPHDLSLAPPKRPQTPNELLLRLTTSIRPFCDYCRVRCGLIWFQHVRSLDPREISNIMKNVNSKNPPLSQREYQYILCVQCYCDGNFPLLLTHKDFKKVSANDKIDPSRKKKNKKRKKEKRRREQEAEGGNEEEGKEAVEEDKSHHDEEDERKRKEELNNAMKKMIDQSGDRKWSLMETSYLLEVLEKHGENWPEVHKEMKKRGYCKDISTEEIIKYFVTLPTRGVTKLNEEFDDEAFIDANSTQNRTTLSQKLAEHKLNQAMAFAERAGPQLLKEISREASRTDYPWKSKLQALMQLKLRAFNQRVDNLQEQEDIIRSLSVFNHK